MEPHSPLMLSALAKFTNAVMTLEPVSLAIIILFQDVGMKEAGVV